MEQIVSYSRKLILCVDKINRLPGGGGNLPYRSPAPTKIITTQQAPHNTFYFIYLFKADTWYTKY